MRKAKMRATMISMRDAAIITGSLLLLFVLSTTTCVAQDIEAKVDEYVGTYLKIGNFSGSILIAKEGRILLSKGYGMANLEHDVPNAPQTIFRLGSVTKQFTSMAIMQLREKGRLDVDDPIAKYLPTYPNGEEITIHHLLTHTSGIPDFGEFPDLQKTIMIPSPVEKTIQRFKDKPLEFTPGEKFKYSNSGYILLGYIIEKVSGTSYEEFLEENIFQPVNMMNTGYDHHDTLLKHRASGYSIGGGGLTNAAYIDMSIPYAAGALYSTVEDLYLWDRALYTEKLVKKSSLDRMFTPFVETESGAIKAHYAYGWNVLSLFDRKVITHSGGINGFRQQIARYVDDDVCIVVLSNIETAPVDKISMDLAAIVFGEEYEVPKERMAAEVNPRIYDAYVGQYELAPDLIVTVTKENNRLFAQATGQPKFELYPESGTKFFARVADIQVTFVKNEKGEVTQLIAHQEGTDTAAKKIK